MLNIENLDMVLTNVLKLPGSIAASIVDWKSGMVLASKNVADFDIELASAGNAEVVKAKMATMKSLKLDGTIKDIMITLSNQIHIIRVLESNPDLFMYLALDSDKANLALARNALASSESDL